MVLKNSKKGIGIIGFGSFGKLAALHLKDGFDVFVADEMDKSEEAKALQARFVSIKEAASKDVVVLSVPVCSLERVLMMIKDSVKPGSLIIDVCSVKMLPAKLMAKILPLNVDILASHPLFGPQSAKNGIEGHKIALCPLRVKNLDGIVSFLEKMGLQVIVTTAEEHDKMMAKTQGLSHFIGKALLNMGIKKEAISVPSFDKLLELAELLKNDSDELLRTIQLDNPFAADVREMFCREISSLQEQFSSSEPLIIEVKK